MVVKMNNLNENERELILETKNLNKNFGSTVALNDVNLKVYRGQITGLIGENGSGKSTITSIAAGMQPPTSGEMFFKGEPHSPSTMIEGAKLGIGMIVQEQGSVSGITIAQNIFLGEEEKFKKFGVINKAKMNKAAKEALENIGFLDVDPSTPIDALNMQDRKLIEIARVLHMNPDLLVVDETTTALSQHGRDIIYKIMNKMKDENKAVIFISHDLEELIETCDTLTVLRDGVLRKKLDKDQMDEATIKRYMVGREMSENYYRSDYDQEISEEIVLDVDCVTSGHGVLRNFSMKVHKGEILGIGGLSHCGMHELGKVIYGEEKLLSGSVTHIESGQKIETAKQSLKLGLGYVSKDRDKEALVLPASIKDNIVAAGLDKVKTFKAFIMPSKEKKYVSKQIEDLSIKCASMDQPVQFLSGGNKQKVVFGKWVGRDCDILILDCPTRGVDIGVKAAMYKLMYEMKKAGKTIVMISEELTELIGMSDRLIILKDGIKSGEFKRDPKLTEHEVIEVMI